jgi:hypothetical protein
MCWRWAAVNVTLLAVTAAACTLSSGLDEQPLHNIAMASEVTARASGNLLPRMNSLFIFSLG